MYFPPYFLDWAHIKSNARSLVPCVFILADEIFQFIHSFFIACPTFSAALNKQGETKSDNLML